MEEIIDGLKRALGIFVFVVAQTAVVYGAYKYGYQVGVKEEIATALYDLGKQEGVNSVILK